jgi:uncharacterized membrane protein
VIVSYFEFLLLIHVAGAIIGFGPTFAFAILGPSAQKAGPNRGVAIMETMVAIEKRMVYPVALVTQPLTGILMIFETNRDDHFFDNEWLVGAIVIYIFILYIALFLNTPLIDKMITMTKEGGPPTPEFEALGKKAGIYGPIMTVGLVVIIFLMVIKPGGY